MGLLLWFSSFYISLVCELVHVSFRMHFIFLVNEGDQVLAFLVENYKKGGGGGRSKKIMFLQ